MLNFKNLLFRKEGKIGILSINNPKSLNALNTEVLTELDHILEQISRDEEVYVLIITGEGESFAAGADIVEMSTMSVEEGRRWAELGMRAFRKIEIMEKPVIAAINGYALGGGCELALSCDLRIASEKARIGQPEIFLGITPGFGGTQRLPRLIGMTKAKEFIYTGKSMNPEEAERIGLVNKVVKPEELMDEVLSLANKIAALPRVAIKYNKVAMNRGIEVDLDAGLEIEKNIFAMCFATEDQKEGMTAFIEKRKPVYKGK